MYPTSGSYSVLEKEKLNIMKALCGRINEEQLERLEPEHISVLLSCVAIPASPGELETWIKSFKAIKDYLFIALIDVTMAQSAYTILTKFYTITSIQETLFNVFIYIYIYI